MDVRETDRDERIAELQARLVRPAWGIRPWLAVVGILTALYFLGVPLRPDLTYFFSSRTPRVVDIAAGTDWGALPSNRVVEVRGVPTARGTFYRQSGDVFVVVGLQDSPLLVRRRALPSEVWKEGEVPPAPDQRPFTVRGRLLSRADAGRYREGFEKIEAMGEIHPRFILLAGETPGADVTPLLLSIGLVLFMVLQLWLWERGRRRA